MYAGKNTSRPASVPAACQRQTAGARSRPQSLHMEKATPFPCAYKKDPWTVGELSRGLSAPGGETTGLDTMKRKVKRKKRVWTRRGCQTVFGKEKTCAGVTGSLDYNEIIQRGSCKINRQNHQHSRIKPGFLPKMPEPFAGENSLLAEERGSPQKVLMGMSGSSPVFSTARI